MRPANLNLGNDVAYLTFRGTKATAHRTVSRMPLQRRIVTELPMVVEIFMTPSQRTELLARYLDRGRNWPGAADRPADAVDLSVRAPIHLRPQGQLAMRRRLAKPITYHFAALPSRRRAAWPP